MINQNFGNLELFTQKQNMCSSRIVDTRRCNHASAINFGSNKFQFNQGRFGSKLKAPLLSKWKNSFGSLVSTINI